MSLAIFNGSPRGKSSNSSIITSWFLSGYGEDNVSNIAFLNKVKQHESYIQYAIDASDLLFVFPLYVDGMPAQVKHFFECLFASKSLLSNKNVTYIIHSGFSEGIQNKTLEDYLSRFSQIMEFHHQGVIVIPGSEGFRIMPASMTKKKMLATAGLGEALSLSQPFDKKVLLRLRGRETLSPIGAFVFKILAKTGLTNFYWNSWLKKNKAFALRFNAPYQKNG